MDDRRGTAGTMHSGMRGPSPVDVARRQRGSGVAIGWIGATAYVLVVLVSLGFILAGAGVGGLTPQLDVQIAGFVGLFLALTLGPIALLIASQRSRGGSEEAQVSSKIDRLTEEIRVLAEQSCLSEDARRVLNRRNERDLLYRAIEEDIAAEEWDAALVLCQELAERFGYRSEAEEFRARIEAARETVQDRNVADAIARLDGLIVQRRWDGALREAGRIQRLYPDSPRVENLRDRVEQARRVYRQELERRFLEASDRDRVEEALSLLKELDGYLTATEAEPYREVARGVIGKARDNLGAQFKLAVHDKRWAQAAGLGRRIINDFPNSRMAEEVRQLLDGILAKANQSASVPAPNGVGASQN